MPSERFTGLAAVLDAVRDTTGTTQPALVEQVGLGRSVVAERVAELEAAGLVASDGLGPSTGGRAPRRLRLRAEAGFVLGIDVASNELVVAVADLAGTIRATAQEHLDVSRGWEAGLPTVEALARSVADEAGARGNVWSVALGMPEPVAFDAGAPVALPTMPSWDGRAVRERLASAWSAPVWMDDRVNLLALGERRVNPVAARSAHMLYLGGGAGLGAAVVTDGRLYRGARGLAGAIGHVTVPEGGEVVCRCGSVGCLEAVVGGAALSRDARLLAETGQSPALAAILAETRALRPLDITRAAEQGDPAARALLHRAATVIGGVLATLVNAYNPELVVVGGGIARARAHVLAAMREAIYRHALPAATRDLQVDLSAVDEEIAGVTGAVQFALDQVFSREHLPALLAARTGTHGESGLSA
ncbi:ROK family transcriptional regulator [Blastococcus sp. MG754426]|uniref:ROK family transcriptional regulator n=1 Tax=unclassified Blastococcus TaxID=2619396 RepID=UPI001EEFA104|nr:MULTISPECIES: ROK family transcriptional regulator [unclassified Blastococcus]MCF6509463.1 ROK family transcriptional regulator [Blastococcus sp. MG754426]MCF6513958.1 ROK family transcriptional regulator [Blastococcus sp. MG754427]